MKNKTLRRFLHLALLVLLLLTSTLIAFAEERGEQRNEDYKATLLWQDDFSKVKNLSTSKSMASYLTYLKKVSGNDILAIAPGISGINSDHVYLSYRSNTQGSAQMIYTGKTSATAPESPCTTDFITLDFDFSAERGIPDGMSVSLNGRAFKDDGSTSASGSAYVFFRDRDGILEIATDNANGSYSTTGVYIFDIR